jgi:predicted TPR repeat methyltransferase
MSRLSSGDLQADRRYQYADDLARQGDLAAAADLLRQALELAPRWAAGWFRLAEVLEDAADLPAAADAFRTAALCDPDDILGAGARLGRILPDDPEARMSQAYVAKLFDQYAPRFDDHLLSALDYRGPDIIVAALREACAAMGRPMAFGLAMDLGCGTGLMAKAIHRDVAAMDGVDISPGMAERAAASGLYRRVRVADAATAFAHSHSDADRYDLILAADVLVYMKDLNQLFHAVAQAIDSQGLFAFTVQSGDGDAPVLGQDMRYSHSPAYLRAAAAQAGLRILHLAPCVTRKDRAADVPGHVAVLGAARRTADDRGFGGHDG